MFKLYLRIIAHWFSHTRLRNRKENKIVRLVSPRALPKRLRIVASTLVRDRQRTRRQRRSHILTPRIPDPWARRRSARRKHSTRDKTQAKALAHASTSRPSRRHHAALRRRTTAPTRTKTLTNNLSVVSASHRSSPPLDPAHTGVKPSTRRSAAREPPLHHRARIGRSLLTQISRRVASRRRYAPSAGALAVVGRVRGPNVVVSHVCSVFTCACALRVAKRRIPPRARARARGQSSQVARGRHVCPVLKKTSVFWFVNGQYTHRIGS